MISKIIKWLKSQEKLHCDFCGKPFGYKKNLKAHIKSKHKGEYLYSCEKDGNIIEGKVCFYKTNGKAEYKVHCLTKKCACSKCGKRFLSKLQLRKHSKHGMCNILKIGLTDILGVIYTFIFMNIPCLEVL